ncbi:hypothetical protein ACFLRX_00630 [Acidobacteriota bacterium]
MIEFRADNEGQIPTKKDWEARKINPSLRTFQRKFGGLDPAVFEAKKYESIDDYENQLFAKEQRRILKDHRRKRKKEKAVGEEVSVDGPAREQKKPLEDQTSNLAMSHRDSGGRYKCYKCEEYRDDWEMTIECITQYGHEDICEDCYSKKGRKE